MHASSDSDICNKLKNGDEAAFNYLYNMFYPGLCFYCNGFINDFDKARSIVQGVYVDLWIKRKQLNIKHSTKSYLYISVKNRSLDYISKHKKTVPFSEEINSRKIEPFHDLIQEAETREQINSLINQLPNKCREIFLLCRFEELKYKQVAEKLNISVKTVEMQMGIAIKKIRTKVADNKTLNLLTLFFIKK